METAITKRSEAASSKSGPIITIYSSTLQEESLEKSDVPYLIIEHVGTGPPTSQSSSSSSNSNSTSSNIVYKCEDCDYSSHNKHYLKQHIDLVHNPQRPYKCPFCDYAGKRSHSLREHLVVHTTDRPFECVHCNASFRKKGHLTNHIKLHTTQKLIECSLCSAFLADQTAFEKHLKEMHKTDKLFACELCDFVAGDKDVIVKHIQTHTKAYKCSECSFVTADMKKLQSHAESHLAFTKAITSPPSSTQLPKPQKAALKQVLVSPSMTSKTESVKPPPLALKPATAKSPSTVIITDPRKPLMMKCTECGFTDPDAEIMKAHMWQHIKPESSKQEKPEPKTVEKPPPPVQLKEIRIIESALPNNAAYKCTECSFVHKEATVFIKHMLSHRVKAMEKTNNEKTPTTDEKTNTSNVVQHQGQTYVVAPVTKENTCKNVENTPFSHDPITGRFRCIICGYTCEYQRTIKAHIWKHSGNKAIDYPMFQNGPLSMYDDIPTPKGMAKTEGSGVYEIVDKSIPVAAHEEVIVSKPMGGFSVANTEPESHKLPALMTPSVTHVRSVSENTVTNIKLVKTDITPKTVAGGTAICQMQTVNGKTLALVRESTPTVNVSPSKAQTTMEASLPIVMEETVVTTGNKPSTTDDTQQKTVISPMIPSIPKILSPSKSPQQQVQKSPSSISQSTSAPDIHEAPVKVKEELVPDQKAVGDVKQEKHTPGEDTHFLQVAKRICSEKETEAPKPVCVVVETVDSVSATADFTGMKSQQNSPRVQEQAQQDEWPDSRTKTPPVDAKSPRSMTTRAKTRQALRAAKDKSDKEKEELQAKQLAALKKAVTEEEGAKKGDSPLTRAKKHSEEAITLLSLLRKGPNVQPLVALQAAGDKIGNVKEFLVPEQIDSETESDDENMSSLMESNKPKTGICSSLLAVIEQLRERSKSESEPEESQSSKTLPGRRQSRRRSRIDSNEDEFNLDSIENMEKIFEDGEAKYRCKLCHYSNSRTLLIRLHMRLHKSKKPFECSLCDFIAVSSEALQEHMIRHCKMRTYPCKLCPSTFNYKSQLRAHMRAHSDKDPLMCHMCDFETNDPMSYRNHLRFHADQYYHKCNLCNKLFVSKTELRSHKLEDCYKDQPGSLEDSDATDSDYEVQRESLKKENLNCSHCEFTTTNVGAFTEHSRIHEETKTLKCEMCDFTAVSSRSLKSHMKRHINDQRYVQQPLEQYKCNLCGYVCHHLPSLKSHMWRHASDRNYSYEFTNDVINAAIDYDCRIDSSNTSDPDMLEKILISEKKILEGRLNNSLGPDGRQPVCWVVFKCCQCGFETINKAHLNVHMRSHSDIIQRTLEVTQGLSRTHAGCKRSVTEALVQRGDNSPSKIIKTQDHG